MPKPLHPRSKIARPRKAELARDLLEELRRTAKPGRANDAIARLSRAVQLLDRGDAVGAAAEAAKAKQLAPRSPTPVDTPRPWRSCGVPEPERMSGGIGSSGSGT